MKRGPNPKTYMLMAVGTPVQREDRGAVGTLVLGVGASYFGYSQMSGVQGEVATLKSEVKDEKAVQQELDAAKTKLDECAVKLKHLEANVPQLAYIPTLMTELEKSGKAFGIKILGVRPMVKQTGMGKKESDPTTGTKKAYEEMSIEVKGLGTYGSVMRWIESLQNFPKIVAARSVQLSPKMEAGQQGTSLDMTVELRAYVFPEKKADKPAEGEASKTASREVKNHEG